MEVGVAQGSLLAPGLFTLCVNDVPVIETAGSIHMFANETTIYYIGREVETIVDALNSILADLHKWCHRNNLILHESKTIVMLISGTPFIESMRETKYGESSIQFYEQPKCLGVIITIKLIFTVNQTTGK